MALSKETHRVLQKSLLVLFVLLAVACFSAKFMLDSYFLENRPRESESAEGRVYSEYIKIGYGDTVYLTKGEYLLSEWMIPIFLALMLVGNLLDMRWKYFAPYKKEKWELPVITKRRDKVKD